MMHGIKIVMKTQTSLQKKLVTVSEMVAIEKEANQNSLSYSDMINNAGAGLANTIIDAYSHLKDRKVLGLIGKGNNGGDALVALAGLQIQGWDTVAYIIGDRSEDDEALKSYVEAAGKVVLNEDEKGKDKLKSELNSAGILLDGLLGTGIRLPLKPPISSVLKNVNKMLETAKLRPMVVAVDCPSGIDCDSGEIAVQTIQADVTVCMAAVKVGMLKLPAFEYVGIIEIVDIGLTSKMKKWESINSWVIDEEMVTELLHERRTDGHKGTFGTAMVLAGSQIYSGAARLAGEAAHRMGAGLVSMCVPEQVYLTQAGHLPEAIWTILPDEDGYISPSGVNTVRETLGKASALLIGPGIGLENSTKKLFNELFLGSKNNKRGQGLIG
ncbi:MAG: NAD(P)H-hydrate epimerase, partial [Chloroflexota bacterium]